MWRMGNEEVVCSYSQRSPDEYVSCVLTVWLQHLSRDSNSEGEVFRDDRSQSLFSQGTLEWQTPFLHLGHCCWHQQTWTWLEVRTMSQLSPVQSSHLSDLIGCIWWELKWKIENRSHTQRVVLLFICDHDEKQGIAYFIMKHEVFVFNAAVKETE